MQKKIIVALYFSMVTCFCFGGNAPKNYIHDTQRTPVYDGFSLDIPDQLGNQILAKLGMVDVTAAPFHADPNGKKDSTVALQKAIHFARDHQMICYLPLGTYRVSDTLKCDQLGYRRESGQLTQGDMYPPSLWGSRKTPGKRPKIILTANSPGFNDIAQPKYLIHFWHRNVHGGKPDEPRPAASRYQLFLNIDIEIEEGNSGAVAIRFKGAEGCGVQDSTIDVRHGHTGIEGALGSGGIHAGIKIVGGRIGLNLTETQPSPVIVGITLIGQSEVALQYNGSAALTAVGLKIISSIQGPAIKNAVKGKYSKVPFHGQISLVDSELVFENETPMAISITRSLTLTDVYIKGASMAVQDQEGKGITGHRKGWVHIKEYAHRVTPPFWKFKELPYQFDNPIYNNGQRQTEDFADVELNKAPPHDLQSKHLWGEDFPSWESDGAVNVKHAPYSAKGDSWADDTEAIQKAIDENEIIFIPKGYYRLTKTLKLKKDTKIVGIAPHLSMFFVREAKGAFADTHHPHPLLESTGGQEATSSLSFCGIQVPVEVPGAYAFRWASGRGSIIRNITVLSRPLIGYGVSFEKIKHVASRVKPLIVVSEGGGGKWYNFFSMETGRKYGTKDPVPDYRNLLVEDTREPLGIYGCCTQYGRGNAQFEINNAWHVSVYGLKGEFNETIIWIRNANHIRLFGFGGNATAYEGKSLFRVENTPNVIICNAVTDAYLVGKGNSSLIFGEGIYPGKWHMIIEKTNDGKEIKTLPMDQPVLYRRGWEALPPTLGSSVPASGTFPIAFDLLHSPQKTLQRMKTGGVLGTWEKISHQKHDK